MADYPPQKYVRAGGKLYENVRGGGGVVALVQVYSNTTANWNIAGSGNGTWLDKITPQSIGTTLTDEYKIRFKLVFNSFTIKTGQESRECQGRTGFAKGSSWAGNPDFLGIRTETVQWQGGGLRFVSRDSGGTTQTEISSSPSGTYYIECENPNNGTTTCKLFTDSTYLTQTGTTLTHTRNPQNLDYFVSEHHNNYSGINLGAINFNVSNAYAFD